MNIKIISDTGADITREDSIKYDVGLIPFHIRIKDEEFLDSDDIDLAKLETALGGVEAKFNLRAEAPAMHSSCPSPNSFLRMYEENNDREIFVLCISSKLSGSYNSACLAARMYQEKNKDKKIYVFDSKSASAGQTALLFKLISLSKQDKSFEEMIADMERYIANHTIYVVLERLNNIINSGRLTNGKALVAKLLNIKPVLEGKDGELVVNSVQRGMKNAFASMVNKLKDSCYDMSDKSLIICHANAIDNAKYVEELVKTKYNFKEIITLQMRGLSTCYADLRGIVVAFV